MVEKRHYDDRMQRLIRFYGSSAQNSLKPFLTSGTCAQNR